MEPSEAWYEVVRDYTLRLVKISSVSPGNGETLVAQEVLNLLHADGLDEAYTASGVDPLEHDPYQRQNAYAFLHGQSPSTLVLLGHIDTVETQDYGALEPWALDPEALKAHLEALCALLPDARADLAHDPQDWMFGRGTIDMKGGVAVNIALMRRFAQVSLTAPLPISIVLLATPDEENESAGVLQAVRFLLRLREEYGLVYAGAINTDYTTARYPADPHRYVYSGTVGKLLPSFLVIGCESHVGDPFDGVDANLLAAALIQQLSMLDDLCDVVRGQITPPPVTLHASDLKAHYDVQLPFIAHFYLNVLTFSSSPADLLQRLRTRAEGVLATVLQEIDQSERRWLQASNGSYGQRPPRSGSVLSYADLYAETVEQRGAQRVEAELATEWDRWPPQMDKRERSLHLVRCLWSLSGKMGPAVVLYYSPPYYPHVQAEPSQLHEAVAHVVAAHPELNLLQQEFYPFISDMSYLRLDPGMELGPLKANMPVWEEPDLPTRPGAYTLPLEAIQQLNLPVVNFGPYGRAAHQRGERLLMSYSFGILPQLLYETIERFVQLSTAS